MPSWTARLTALGFALGSVEHAVGLVLLLFGVEMYPHYPAWRHAVFTAADATIAWVSIRHWRWRVYPLLAFLVEQMVTNGRWAWREWTTSRHVLWVVVVMHVLILAATVAAGRDARRAGDSR